METKGKTKLVWPCLNVFWLSIRRFCMAHCMEKSRGRQKKRREDNIKELTGMDLPAQLGQLKTGQDAKDRETQIIVDSHTPFVVPQQVRIASSESVIEGLMDDVLNTLFAEILGVDVFQTFVETKPDQWLDMKTSLIPKLNLKDRQRNSVTLLLSIEMLMFYETMKGKTLKEAIAANSALATNVSIIGNKMRIGDHFFRKFYEMPAKKVILLITTALRSLQEERIDTIFIIGKLTKGSYLQNIIRSSFADITFVFPTEPETAVVRGAVIHSFCQQEK